MMESREHTREPVVELIAKLEQAVRLLTQHEELCTVEPPTPCTKCEQLYADAAAAREALSPPKAPTWTRQQRLAACSEAMAAWGREFFGHTSDFSVVAVVEARSVTEQRDEWCYYGLLVEHTRGEWMVVSGWQDPSGRWVTCDEGEAGSWSRGLMELVGYATRLYDPHGPAQRF